MFKSDIVRRAEPISSFVRLKEFQIMVKPSASPTSSHLAASRLRKLLHHQDSGVSRTWQKLASADEPYEKWRINPAHIDHLKRLGLINDELEPTPEAREAYEMLQAEWERTQSHRVSE